MSKGQSTVVVLLFVIIIIGMLFVFLLTVGKSISNRDFTNIYTHNLLLSIMRADTGYGGQNCKQVSDMITCAFFSSGEERCSGSDVKCRPAAISKLDELVSKFQTIKDKYRYLFIVEADSPAFEMDRLLIGDEDLDCDPRIKECPKIEKLVANERIIKQTSVGMQNLRVRLILSLKD